MADGENPPEHDGIRTQVWYLEKRLQAIEKYEPAVMHSQMRELNKKIDGVNKALWALVASVTGGAIGFAIIALQVFGGH